MSSAGHARRVAQAAVGDDPGAAAGQRAGGEDVADRPRARLAPGSITSTSPGPIDSTARFWASSAARRLAHVLAQRHVAQRVGVAEQPQVRPRRPQAAMNVVWMPRRLSCTVSVAVETCRSAALARRSAPAAAGRGAVPP